MSAEKIQLIDDKIQVNLPNKLLGGTSAINQIITSNEGTSVLQLQKLMRASELMYQKKKSTNFLDKAVAWLFNQDINNVGKKVETRYSKYLESENLQHSDERYKSFLQHNASDIMDGFKQNKTSNKMALVYSLMGAFGPLTGWMKGEQGGVSAMSEIFGSGLSALLSGRVSQGIASKAKELGTKHKKLRFLKNEWIGLAAQAAGWPLLESIWGMTVGKITDSIDGPEKRARMQQLQQAQMGGLAPGMAVNPQYTGAGLTL